MADEERTGSCPCCQRRDPRRKLVCDACRSRLRSRLAELPDLYDRLVVEGHPVMVGRGLGGPVSGSRERRLPIAVDRHDLTAPARNVHLVGDDQVGYDSVAGELDFWVRDWREARGGQERLPDPEVRTLALWLERRAEDACDSHPAVDEMFDALGRLTATMRRLLGEVEVPDYKQGVPCRRCDAMALVRVNGSDWIECTGCPELLSPEEYGRWTKLLAEQAKTTRREKAA